MVGAQTYLGIVCLCVFGAMSSTCRFRVAVASCRPLQRPQTAAHLIGQLCTLQARCLQTSTVKGRDVLAALCEVGL